MRNSKSKGWYWLILLLGVYIGANLIFGGSLLWKCPFLAITGLKCTGCGGQRAVLEIFQGHIGQAIYYNAMLPILLLYGLITILKKFHLKPFEKVWEILTGKIAVGILLLLGVAFTIIRNTSLWPWY